ncbi:hypothetical protein HanOQP8_Chr04g0149631 [Helianthus annuus]|nr:hypothetical protein HanIR_Chr04g0180561 [Helianthus annuus]KAJ0757739.1 hypothetical protein HanLR1_Chr04g0142281 [Helianthus annuus]KAJ0761416.1 hypothetical protein HanOQP8_Chr04g0149631 [Helianthus annuus]
MRIRALEMVSELKERITRAFWFLLSVLASAHLTKHPSTIMCSRTFKSMNSTEEFVIRS